MRSRSRLVHVALSIGVLGLHAQEQQTASNSAAKADTYVREEVAKRRIPGVSVAVIAAGTVVFAKGYGFASVELSTPATSDTVYEIASLTKPFTAIAVMMLVEARRIALDDPISKHLPKLPSQWDAIRVRHLLTNTSGIPDYFSIPTLRSAPGGIWQTEYAPTDVLNILSGTQLEFSPGSRFVYSNSGYWLLGQLIEAVTRDSYERFLSDRIFVPLEMKATRRMDRKAIIPNRASGYAWNDGVLLNAPHTSTTWAYSEGGLASSVSDLAKWDAALWSGRLLRAETLAQMAAPVRLTDGTDSNYGLGWNVGINPKRKQIYVTGNKPGFSAIVRRYLDERLTVIVLANIESGIDLGGMAFQLASFFSVSQQ
jgi:D-alanyl-D-alanine carboxypeptidase